MFLRNNYKCKKDNVTTFVDIQVINVISVKECACNENQNFIVPLYRHFKRTSSDSV